MGHQRGKLASQWEELGGEEVARSKAFRCLAIRIVGVCLIHFEEEMHRKLEAFLRFSVLSVVSMLEEGEE